MLQENYKVVTELTKSTPTYTSQGLKLFEKVVFNFSQSLFEAYFLIFLHAQKKRHLWKCPWEEKLLLTPLLW